MPTFNAHFLFHDWVKICFFACIGNIFLHSYEAALVLDYGNVSEHWVLSGGILLEPLSHCPCCNGNIPKDPLFTLFTKPMLSNVLVIELEGTQYNLPLSRLTQQSTWFAPVPELVSITPQILSNEKAVFTAICSTSATFARKATNFGGSKYIFYESLPFF